MDGTEKGIRDGKRKIGLTIPVIVEGRYDKARLAGVVDAVILTTDGFAVFRNGEKRAHLCCR